LRRRSASRDTCDAMLYVNELLVSVASPPVEEWQRCGEQREGRWERVVDKHAKSRGPIGLPSRC
jgi:hypothetical protein